jgi:hypothetical protein
MKSATVMSIPMNRGVDRRALRLAAALSLVLGSFVGAGSASAGPSSVTCTTEITGTVTENVIVPSGEVYALTSGAVVVGNITVSKNARLFVDDGVTINGNAPRSRHLSAR